MAKMPTGEPFFRVTFPSTDDYLILSARLDSRANAAKVAAALSATPPAIILETSPNSEHHPLWWLNRSGRSLVVEFGIPLTFSEPIAENRLPRGLSARVGEYRGTDLR